MNTNTPGPWTINHDSNLYDECHVGIDSPAHGELAVVVWKIADYDNSPECEANARLIAAAPELYEFIQQVSIGNSEYDALQTAARNLISKVES